MSTMSPEAQAAGISSNAVGIMIGRSDTKYANLNNGIGPVLQAISVKTINDGARVRVILSDSTVYAQAMLASQLNPLAIDPPGPGQLPLETGCLVRINDYMVNDVSGKKFIILLELDVIGPAQERIGQPIEYDHNVHAAVAPGGGGTGGTGGGTMGGPNAAAPMYNRTNTAGSVASGGGYNPYGAGSPSTGSGSVGHNPYSPAKRNTGPIVQNRGGAGGSNGMMGGGSSGITPISQLNMYQNRFTIKARVTSKSDIKTWSNAKGEGSLFSVEFLDASGVDIRATMFKESVDKFYNMFEVGKVYTITGAKLKVANQAYNTCKSQLEMTIDHNTTEVHLVADTGDISAQSFDFVKIGALEQVEEKKNVDVLAVVQEVGEVQSLTSKKTGNELLKCDVTLIDDTGVQVRLTLWGKTAQDAHQKLPSSDGSNNKPIVAFRRARVSDYGGKTLSGGDMHVEPAIPEVEELRQWWNAQGSRSAPNKSLSSSGGAGGRVDTFTERKVIRDIKQHELGRHNEKGDYLSFRAYFSFLKKDKEGGAWYTACPNKEEPCRNRCKVNMTTDGSYQCDRCHGVYPNCTHKWIFSGTVSDDTSTTWVSIFDEQAQQMFGGVTADQVQQEFASNQDMYDSYFAKAAHTEWILKCRVKMEDVNGDERLKTQVVRMDPVNYVSECREMIAALEKM